MNHNKQLYRLTQLAVDLLIIVGVWFSSFPIRFYSHLIPSPKGIPDGVVHLKLAPFVVVIWFLIFWFSGYARRAPLIRTRSGDALDVVRTCLLASLMFVGFAYFYNEYVYSRATILIFVLLHPFALIIGHRATRRIFRLYQARKPGRRVLLISTPEQVTKAYEVAKANPFDNTLVEDVILIGTAPGKNKAIKNLRLNFHDVPESWIDFFSAHPCEQIIIALPMQASSFFDDNLPMIADQVSDIQIVLDLDRFSKFSTGIDFSSGVPLVSIHESPLVGWGAVAKRIYDIGAGAVALTIFGPIMILLAGLVKLTSPGPVFYRQERMGLDGRTFDILKFRTMRYQAKEAKSEWTVKGDQRITYFGNFLRKSSLDELPQLLNVLKGDMSLVGPRPERPFFVANFRRSIPGYMLRHKVKAGMTGWAQVNGWRGDTSIERRIECDLYYIKHWSLWMDTKILILTAFRGFFNTNAY